MGGASAAAAVAGFATGISLILAIGAQNAFVLRQGLRRAHVFWVCLVCALSDAALIAVGVTGFGVAAEAAPWLVTAMTWAGAAFLFVYGALRFHAALHAESMSAKGAAEQSLIAAILACLAFTWGNPHVYLDTLALIGAVGARYPMPDRAAFGAGAAAASFVFFFALGYGARVLAPVFARPAAWRVLDVAVGALMWTIAASLVL